MPYILERVGTAVNSFIDDLVHTKGRKLQVDD